MWIGAGILFHLIVVFTGNAHVYNTLGNTVFQGRLGPSIAEFQIFSNREVLARNNQPWPISSMANQKEVSPETEVKFEDEHSLYAIIRSAVKHSLGQFNIAPILDFDRNPSLDTQYSNRNSTPSTPKISVNPSFNPFDANESYNHKKPNPEGWEQLYEGLEAGQPQETETIETSLFEESQERHTLLLSLLYTVEYSSQYQL